jgi:hypothetical protein
LDARAALSKDWFAMVLLLAFVVVAAASPWFSEAKCLYQEDSENMPIAGNPIDLQLTESTIGQLSSDVLLIFGDVLIVDEHEVCCLAKVMKQSYLSPCSHVYESTGLPETRGSFCEEGGIECDPFQLPHIRLGEPPGHILANSIAIEHQFNQRERVSENDLGHPQTIISTGSRPKTKQNAHALPG